MCVVYNEFDLLAESPSKGRGPKKTLKSLVSCQTPLGLLLNQFTCAQNRPKSDISGALGPIYYITLKAFAMALGGRTKCKTCFGCPRMVLCGP